MRLAAVFALLLLAGCGPSQQEKQNWESFNSHFESADTKYLSSSRQMKRLLGSATGYGDDAMISAIRSMNLSFWVKESQQASAEVTAAENDFSYLYANSKEVPAAMKSDLYRFKEIVNANARFVQNAQDGRLSLDGLKQWAKGLDEYESAYQGVHLEVKKVFAKHSWFFVDTEAFRH